MKKIFIRILKLYEVLPFIPKDGPGTGNHNKNPQFRFPTFGCSPFNLKDKRPINRSALALVNFIALYYASLVWQNKLLKQRCEGLGDNAVFMLFESSVNKTINISLPTELDKLLMVTRAHRGRENNFKYCTMCWENRMWTENWDVS